MNPEIKAAWVAALRSGKYKQGAGMLQNLNGNMCCLGVLCEISNQDIWEEQDDEPGFKYLGEFELAPDEIVQWAGLPDNNPSITVKNDEDEPYEMALAELNDGGSTFLEIADLIEEQL